MKKNKEQKYSETKTRQQKTQGSKSREVELISKKVGKRKRKKKVVPKKKLIETPSESNINTAVGEHVSSANYTF